MDHVRNAGSLDFADNTELLSHRHSDMQEKTQPACKHSRKNWGNEDQHKIKRTHYVRWYKYWRGIF